MSSWPGIFQFRTFLIIALSESMCIFGLKSSSSSCISFSMLIIHILLQNCSASFSSSCWCVSVHSVPTSRIFSFFLLWNVLFCLYCFVLSQYRFSFLSFACSFWFISSSCIVCVNCCVAIVFSFQHLSAFYLCLSIFACRRRFLICASSLISDPGFEFLFVFFRVTLILSLTNFTPA